MTRKELLDWARQEIVTPRSAFGHGPIREGHYWSVIVAKSTYFSVDALVNGTLRVHLYSSDDRVKQGWNARLETAQPVPGAQAWTPSSGRPDNGPGRRGYLRCEWKAASSDFAPEREIVEKTAEWLDQFY